MGHRPALFLFLPFFCLFSIHANAQKYTITDLGPLTPTAMNSWAQVVGTNNNQAYLWAFGRARALGTIPGGTFSNATSINDLGVVAGVADGAGTITFPDGTTQSCNDLIQPFLWTQGGGIHGLGSPAAGPLEDMDICDVFVPYYGSRATGINRFGKLAGTTYDIESYKYGLLWSQKTNWSLFTNDYQTTANGINNVGQIVGEDGAEFLDELAHAAIWVNGAMTDLGSLGGDATDWSYCSGANGNNDRNQVVGWSNPADSSTGTCEIFQLAPVHAFLWDAKAGMQDLGTLSGDSSSLAVKINFFGQVIGESGTFLTLGGPDNDAVQVTGRPFVWSAHKGMQDLNTLIPPHSGWVLNTATDINFWGQIVGSGTRNGQTHGYLLTPELIFF
jgi:probable HAF family extracellular repeat protein